MKTAPTAALVLSVLVLDDFRFVKGIHRGRGVAIIEAAVETSITPKA